MRSKSKRRTKAAKTVGRPFANEVDQRIQKLLDVAAEVFLENGFERASVGEIARRANASKQTIYSRYATKADLFAGVMKRRSEAGFDALSELDHSEKPFEEILTIYANILIFPLVDRDTLRFLRAIIGTAETVPQVGKDFWAMGPTRVHRMVEHLFKRRIEDGTLRSADPVQAAHIFIAMCTGRFWSEGIFGVGPQATRSEIERYIKALVRDFLKLYGAGV